MRTTKKTTPPPPQSAASWRPRTCRSARAHDLQWLTPERAVCVHATGQCAHGVWLWRAPAGEAPRLVFCPDPVPARGMQMQGFGGWLKDRQMLAQTTPERPAESAQERPK